MRDKILRLELYDKFEDESLIKEVLSSLPVRVENTLTHYRTKILGKVPIDRDSYDPPRMGNVYLIWLLLSLHTGIYLRCIKSIYDEEKFICQDCSPSSVDSSVASPAPAMVQPVQCSLEERSDISPEQDTQPLSGEHWFKP